MDYFTIFSRRIGSGKIFEQARKTHEEINKSITEITGGEH